MGHFAENNIYRKLGRKIDNLTIKVPWNKTLYSILTELYKKYLLNTAQLCWADENRFAKR